MIKIKIKIIKRKKRGEKMGISSALLSLSYVVVKLVYLAWNFLSGLVHDFRSFRHHEHFSMQKLEQIKKVPSHCALIVNYQSSFYFIYCLFFFYNLFYYSFLFLFFFFFNFILFYHLLYHLLYCLLH